MLAEARLLAEAHNLDQLCTSNHGVAQLFLRTATSVLLLAGATPQVHDGTYTPADQFVKDPDSLCSTVTWKDEEDRVIWVYRIQVCIVVNLHVSGVLLVYWIRLWGTVVRGQPLPVRCEQPTDQQAFNMACVQTQWLPQSMSLSAQGLSWHSCCPGASLDNVG